jgi:alpha-tubulin suppressor-like RCC1 family protein
MSTPFRFKNADNTTVDFEDYYVRADYFRSGNLWAWGWNSYGQLGDNTTTNRSSPIQTIARGSNWKSVACGYNHTAAIKTDGTLWVWGRNSYGKLGDNTTDNKSSPVQTVAFGTNWIQISCGTNNTAAIKTDGTLWCWGKNLDGQLGDNTGSSETKSSPVQTVAFGTNWKQVSISRWHTAALKTDGTLWCWGQNTYGNLGDNTTTHRSSPVQTVAFGTNWKQVSCGDSYTAAIKNDGTLWCWGKNTHGQLGDNTSLTKLSPVQTIAFGTNWKYVGGASGQFYGMITAVKTDGTLWCWGNNNYGQLGDNTMVLKLSPVQTVCGGTNWKQSSIGHVATGIKTDGTLWCWGYNNYGSLGDNTRTNRSSPIQTIMYGTNWKEVTCGANTTAAIQYQDDYQ